MSAPIGVVYACERPPQGLEESDPNPKARRRPPNVGFPRATAPGTRVETEADLLPGARERLAELLQLEQPHSTVSALC